MKNKDTDQLALRDELILGLQRENAAQAKVIRIQSEMIRTMQQYCDERQKVLEEFTDIDPDKGEIREWKI